MPPSNVGEPCLPQRDSQVHIRDNIFHYMHAIWASTHPDHRYFELYDDEVPFSTLRIQTTTRSNRQAALTLWQTCQDER